MTSFAFKVEHKTTTTTEKEVIEIAKRKLQQVAKMYNVNLENYKFVFNIVDTLGVVAGECRYATFGTTFTINFNRQIIERVGSEAFTNTITHEIAHAIQHIVYRYAKQKHGPEFREIHASMGGNGKTYHDYDVVGLRKRKLKRFVYVCGCQTHYLSTRTHNKVLKSVGGFCCKTCRNSIVFVKQTTIG